MEFNGLPALSNGYIVDGLETNDPLTNLNSGLSTNLVLGLNSISEVTVNTLSYSVDQGRYGASQVNYVTKSGTNQFHGNLYELWNGALLNAADYFTNATPGNHKPRSTVNHFGGSLGGPILHNKLFFFFDSEWVRIALPIVTPTIVPSAAFQQYVLQQLPLGLDRTRRATLFTPPRRSRCRSINKCFRFTKTRAVHHGNTRVSRLRRVAPTGRAFRIPATTTNRCRRPASTTTSTRRIRPGFVFSRTRACKPPAPIRSIRCSTRFRRSRSIHLQRDYTHVFSQNLVNYFNPAFSWYESLFGPSNFQKTLAAFPIVLQGSGAKPLYHHRRPRQHLGSRQARLAVFHQRQSRLEPSALTNSGFGTNTRIFRLNDYDFGEGTVPTVTYANLQQFIYGVANTASETFPSTQTSPSTF